jgi:LemA protein
MSIFFVIIFVSLLIVGYFFNKLVMLSMRVKSAWADIDVQLKRRHDLVPNLVEIVKSYAVHEKSTLEAVVAARNQATAVSGLGSAQAEMMLASNLRSLIGLVENYPNLKADGTFLQLHTQLVEIEDTLQYARRYYNGSVRDFNTALESFPGNLIANAFGFKTREFFQLDNAQDAATPQAKL